MNEKQYSDFWRQNWKKSLVYKFQDDKVKAEKHYIMNCWSKIMMVKVHSQSLLFIDFG